MKEAVDYKIEEITTSQGDRDVIIRFKFGDKIREELLKGTSFMSETLLKRMGQLLNNDENIGSNMLSNFPSNYDNYVGLLSNGLKTDDDDKNPKNFLIVFLKTYAKIIKTVDDKNVSKFELLKDYVEDMIILLMLGELLARESVHKYKGNEFGKTVENKGVLEQRGDYEKIDYTLDELFKYFKKAYSRLVGVDNNVLGKRENKDKSRKRNVAFTRRFFDTLKNSVMTSKKLDLDKHFDVDDEGYIVLSYLKYKQRTKLIGEIGIINKNDETKLRKNLFNYFSNIQEDDKYLNLLLSDKPQELVQLINDYLDKELKTKKGNNNTKQESYIEFSSESDEIFEVKKTVINKIKDEIKKGNIYGLLRGEIKDKITKIKDISSFPDAKKPSHVMDKRKKLFEYGEDPVGFWGFHEEPKLSDAEDYYVEHKWGGFHIFILFYDKNNIKYKIYQGNTKKVVYEQN